MPELKNLAGLSVKQKCLYLYEYDFKAIDFMELILKSNNENSIAKIIALAKKLDVTIEQRDKVAGDKKEKEQLKKRILNFKAKGSSSFGDAAEWERNEREDHELPFSK